MLDSVELGETAHKKAGTTVPESIHSFSKSALPFQLSLTWGSACGAENPQWESQLYLLWCCERVPGKPKLPSLEEGMALDSWHNCVEKEALIKLPLIWISTLKLCSLFLLSSWGWSREARSAEQKGDTDYQQGP